MKLWKVMCIVTIGMFVLSTTVSASPGYTEDDDANDVYHVGYTNYIPTYQTYTGSKPEIDIDSIEVLIDEVAETITLSMTMVGEVQADSDYYAYMVQFNTSDAAYIMACGQGLAQDASIVLTDDMSIYLDSNFTSTGNVTVSTDGKTISTVLSLVGATDNVDIWGIAYEYEELYTTNPLADFYVDAAGSYSLDIDDSSGDSGDGSGDTGDGSGDTGDGSGNTTDGTGSIDNGENGDSSSSGTPGFEVAAVLCALVASVVLIRRRK